MNVGGRRILSPLALATWLALFLVMAAWALSMPVGSGPDESGHIMKAAATVRGQFTGTPTDTEGIRAFVLPANVGALDRVVDCFAGKPNQTAACAPSLGDAGSDPATVLSGVAAYNPVYYALVGWPSLLWSGTAMVLMMRLVNAVLVSLLWSIVFVTLPGRSLGSLFLLAASATPLAVYLGGVVNPSGAEIAATAAAFALSVTVIRQRARGRLWLVLLIVVLALLVSLRSVSPVLALCAVGAAAAVCGARSFWSTLVRRRVLVGFLVLAAVGLFAVVWILAVSGPAGYIPSAGTERPGKLAAFFGTLEQFPDYFQQMIGVLGWFDTWLPDYVYLVWTAVVAGGILLSLALSSARAAAIILAVVALGILFPAVLQAATASEFGYIWQGRYSLPFLALALAVGAFAIRRQTAGVAVWRFAVGIFVLIALQIAGFVEALKRFAAGAGAPWEAMGSAYAWRPAVGVEATVILFVVGAILLVLLAVARARQVVTSLVARRGYDPSLLG